MALLYLCLLLMPYLDLLDVGSYRQLMPSHSRSFKAIRSYTYVRSYQLYIVYIVGLNMCLSYTFDRSPTSPCSSSNCNYGHILYRFRNKARYRPKTPIFHTSFRLTCTISQTPSDFFPEILTQTVRVLKLLGGAKNIVEKFNTLSRVHQRFRRQTDLRRQANVTQ